LFILLSGVDNAESECGLDDGVTWDFEICNDGNQRQLEQSLHNILQEYNRMIKANDGIS